MFGFVYTGKTIPGLANGWTNEKLKIKRGREGEREGVSEREIEREN
jgi:hypothetical protein